MKIGFVYDMIYPYSKGGGEKRFYHLATSLARRHEVHWVGMKLWQGPSTIVTESGVTLHGVLPAPVRLYGENGRRSIIEALWFGAVLLQWPGLRKMDVIDCSCFPFFSIYSARALARLGGASMVTTWHEYWGDYWREYAPRMAPIGRMVERLALACCGPVISVSRFTRERLIQAGLSSSKVDVVPNGIDVEAIDRASPLPNGPDVLYLGRLIPEKRVDVLLRAMAADPLLGLKSSCWIIGNGPEADRLKELAVALGVDSRVRFESWVPEDQVYGAMKAAKAFVLPSDREGFGMVALEAMACGTPAVVTTGSYSAAPDLVEDGSTGYVVPCEPSALSEALAAVVGSPRCQSRLGANARTAALEYRWERIAEQAEAVYGRAAGNGHSKYVEGAVAA